MDNQRVIGRPAFRSENAAHRIRIARVGGQSVDRLGGHADEFTAAQCRNRQADVVSTTQMRVSKSGSWTISIENRRDIGTLKNTRHIADTNRTQTH